MTESLYIHIPFCNSKCSYCDFFSVPGKSENYIDSYISALKNEILFRIRQFDILKLKTVYIGGGTPSLLSVTQLKQISGILKPYIDEKTEFTIEMNPEDVTEEKIAGFSSCNVNRISIGIQAFSDSVLKNVNRRSNSEKNEEALRILSEKFNGEISADLICALPFQSEENFLQGLNHLLSYRVSHVSVYSLTFEEDTPLFKLLENGKIDYDFDKADDLWIKGRDFLIKNGFEHYEVSNFYKKASGKACHHNMTYWRLENYAGCGSGGTGSFYGEKSFRYTNTKDIKRYITFWSSEESNSSGNKNHEDFEEVESLSEDIIAFEFFMMGLRTKTGVNLSDFDKRFNLSVPEKYKAVMEKWISNKKAFCYYAGGNRYFALNENGLLFLNQFLQEILL